MLLCCQGTFDFACDSSLSNVLLLTAEPFSSACDEAKSWKDQPKFVQNLLLQKRGRKDCLLWTALVVTDDEVKLTFSALWTYLSFSKWKRRIWIHLKKEKAYLRKIKKKKKKAVQPHSNKLKQNTKHLRGPPHIICIEGTVKWDCQCWAPLKSGSAIW